VKQPGQIIYPRKICTAEIYCIHSKKESMIYDNVVITTQTMNIYVSYIKNAEINSEVILAFGSAIVQAVSRWVPTAAAGVRTR
jgi:hypothetical protein